MARHVPHVRHLVDVAMKAGPGATAWILVCERACSVTSRALDVSRDKVHMSCFTKGERTCLGAASRTRSRTNIARILTRIPLKTKL